MARRDSFPRPFCLFDMMVLDWSPSATGGIQLLDLQHRRNRSSTEVASNRYKNRWPWLQQAAGGFDDGGGTGISKTSPGGGLGATDTNIVVTLPRRRQVSCGNRLYC